MSEQYIYIYATHTVVHPEKKSHKHKLPPDYNGTLLFISFPSQFNGIIFKEIVLKVHTKIEKE